MSLSINPCKFQEVACLRVIQSLLLFISMTVFPFSIETNKINTTYNVLKEAGVLQKQLLRRMLKNKRVKFQPCNEQIQKFDKVKQVLSSCCYLFPTA